MNTLHSGEQASYGVGLFGVADHEYGQSYG
jgi:hypothetical protein